MRKQRAALLVLLAAGCFLCACARLPGREKANSLHPPSPRPDAALTYFYFRESRSYVQYPQGYEFRAGEGAPTAYFIMDDAQHPMPVEVDQQWADTLEGLIRQYNMTGWNGFSGSAPRLLDGTGFSVEWKLEDGTHIQAAGYGKFPDGYGEASAALQAHFMSVFPQEMGEW